MSLRGVLLVSEDEFFIKNFKERLKEEGFEVYSAQSRVGIFRILKKHQVGVLVFFRDFFLSRELLEHLKPYSSHLEVMVKSESNYGWLERIFPSEISWKTFEDTEHFIKILKQECEDKKEFKRLGIIGSSLALCQVLEQVKKVSKTNLPVLIIGESGTGKELIARAIHYLGPKSWEPFLAINCASIPETLLESELFGYEKGAFTGAEESQPGKVGAVGEGTLFLDEISEMSLSLQAKLLRLLQNREYLPLGASRPRYAMCRIITATNQDLVQLVREGRFRSDLFFRLNVFPIRVPPLRERREDIPLLVRHFIKRFNQKYFCQVEGISEKALEVLVNLPWEGNVRELENLIARVVLFKERGVIELEDLPEECRTHQPVRPQMLKIDLKGKGLDFKKAVNEFENQLILEALARTGGNKNQAAQLLGLKRTTLVEMMKRKGLIA